MRRFLFCRGGAPPPYWCDICDGRVDCDSERVSAVLLPGLRLEGHAGCIEAFALGVARGGSVMELVDLSDFDEAL
jgi:hypothetical protein